MKRTSVVDLRNWDDASDLERMVVDKRSYKRANAAKGRRRNRRCSKRLLDVQLRINQEFFDEFDE